MASIRYNKNFILLKTFTTKNQGTTEKLKIVLRGSYVNNFSLKNATALCMNI